MDADHEADDYGAALEDYNRSREEIVSINNELAAARALYAVACQRLAAAKACRPRNPVGRPPLPGGSRSEREKDARREARGVIRTARLGAAERLKEIERDEKAVPKLASSAVFRIAIKDKREEMARENDPETIASLKAQIENLMEQMWEGKGTPQHRKAVLRDWHRAQFSMYVADHILPRHPEVADEWRAFMEAEPPVSAVEDRLLALVTRIARL